MAVRIISALVAIIIAVIILIFSHTIVFNLAIAFLSVVMVTELFNAKKLTEFKLEFALCMIYSAVMPFMAYSRISEYRYLIITAFTIAIFCAFLKDHSILDFEKLSYMITSTVLSSLAMCTLVYLKDVDKEHGVFYLVMALCGAWLSDSGAYFTGTLLGKHKLCPTISPKKTIEGAIGGALTNALIFVIIGFIYSSFVSSADITLNYGLLIALGLICSFLGVLGDLSASLIKRQCNIKDFGKIMPGHGGVLDRFDSVLFVAPFMYISLQLVHLIK